MDKDPWEGLTNMGIFFKRVTVILPSTSSCITQRHFPQGVAQHTETPSSLSAHDMGSLLSPSTSFAR